jgi:hypothetical protein
LDFFILLDTASMSGQSPRRAQYACVVSLTTPAQVDGEYFRRELCVHEELVHITVEVDHL